MINLGWNGKIEMIANILKSISMHGLMPIFLLFFYACVLIPTGIDNPQKIPGIVKIKNRDDSVIRYTHRYQRGTIKALPMIITTGIKKGMRQVFTEIEFKSYNKGLPLRYDTVELFNTRGDKWQWNVDNRNKKYIKKKHYVIEQFSARIDSKIDDLLIFMKHQPLYLKLSGERVTFKPLDEDHVQSMINILLFSKIMD